MLPAAVLRQSALEHNSRWMRRFIERTGVKLCPHGKTTMSPDLMRMQLEHGAWGITAATASHVRVYRRHGIQRVLLANQLVGRQNIGYILDELRHDPSFDFYALVDSVDGVRILDEATRATPPPRPLQLLVEVGFHGGRTGVRNEAEGLAVADAVCRAPHLCIRGVEAFEGSVQGAGDAETQVRRLLARVISLAKQLDAYGCFGADPILLSAGGSAYFDLVSSELPKAGLSRPVDVVLRSGCYLTHDSGWYEKLFASMTQRGQLSGAEISEGLRPALEVWGYVQSRPELGRAIVGVGKRDISHDVELPRPLWQLCAGRDRRPARIAEGHHVRRLDDQHAYVDVPERSVLKVGDMMALGVSHPCTTFDKWRALYVVDDNYEVCSVITTYF